MARMWSRKTPPSCDSERESESERASEREREREREGELYKNFSKAGGLGRGPAHGFRITWSLNPKP